MRLVRVEWSRLFARRFTRIMMIVILFVLAAVAAGVAVNSHTLTPADHARARAQIAEQQRIFEQAKADCEAALARGENVTRRYGPNCDLGQPAVEDSWYLPYQFDFRREMSTFLLVSAGVLTLFGFVVGASFVGAEWTSGGMTNLLLWRPRRLLVLASKLVTMLVGVALISVLYIGAWVGAFWLIGTYRGTTGKVTTGLWESLALTGARAVGLGLAAAAAGFAIASLGRHTATALGVGIGYALVVEVGSLIVFSALGLRDPQRYRLSTYVIGWLFKRYELTSAGPANCTANGCAVHTYVITWGMSSAVLGAVVAVVVLLAFVAMRRRDVT
jgi:ABC-2 type transport system permease protein